MTPRRAALLGMVGLLVGCAQATEIVLVVDTDLGVPADLERVEIDVLNDRTARTSTGVDFTMPAAPALPLVLGITARREGAPVEVEVRGYLASGDILVRDVSTTIVTGSSRMLRVVLAQRCVGRACAVGETCDESGCRDVEIAGSDLPGWGGSIGRVGGEACTPEDEICNLADDDCDDSVDEDIALATNPDHCGRCGHVCSAGACTGGFCAGEAPERIVAGGAHTCVVRENGNVACFGWNLDGQLGASGTTSRSIPVDVALSGVTAITLGGTFTCALTSAGAVRCFGGGDDGALGNGTTNDARAPMPVTTSSTYAAIGAGVGHVCAVTSTGEVECWGRNDARQLGIGTTTPALVPTAAWSGMLGGVVSIAAGLSHTCAMRSDATVACWGGDVRGQLGDGTVGGAAATPATVVALDSVAAITAGRDFTCALRSEGDVLCWGANDFGQLGSAGGLESATPLAVTGITDATAIAAAPGGTHACALLSDGSVRCWGSNTSGQLGDGGTDPSTDPREVMGIGTAIAIAVGGLDDTGRGHSCAVETSGAVRCWGDGALAQNGDVLGADRGIAAPVAGLP